MPVTVTAKRALRSSARKESVNNLIRKNLEVAVRVAKKSKKPGDIIKAISLTDRAVKTNLFHANKAARLKSQLARIASLTSKKNKKK